MGLHTWTTEPFTFNELLRVVVRTRAASATRWCMASKRWRSILEAETSVWSVCWTLLSFILCALRTLAFWASIVYSTYLLARLLRPFVSELLELLAFLRPYYSFQHQVTAELLTCGLALLLMAFGMLLTAGLTEVSFLPAKAILSLERKAETEKVREQLAILLRGDCCSNPGGATLCDLHRLVCIHAIYVIYIYYVYGYVSAFSCPLVYVHVYFS